MTEKIYTRQLFGTQLQIAAFGYEIQNDDIQACFTMAQRFEQKYSRFISGNFLSELNTQKVVSNIDTELISLIKLSRKVSEMSEGYFDITLLPVLENLGYGIATGELEQNTGYENIVISGNGIELQNGVSIELGAVGKGFMVDKIYNLLSQKYQNFIVNFGGDIRVLGEHNMILEDPYDHTKQIGNYKLHNSSLASSGRKKRVMKSGSHHLINPHKQLSENGKVTVFVIHPLSVFADIFATALFVSPIEIGKKMIQRVENLEALIILESGEIYKSPGFQADLHI